MQSADEGLGSESESDEEDEEQFLQLTGSARHGLMTANSTLNLALPVGDLSYDVKATEMDTESHRQLERGLGQIAAHVTELSLE